MTKNNVNLAQRLPTDVQKLVASGSYNLYHSKNNTGFIVITKLNVNFSFDENGNYLGEASQKPDLNAFDQIYTMSSSEIINVIKYIK